MRPVGSRVSTSRGNARSGFSRFGKASGQPVGDDDDERREELEVVSEDHSHPRIPFASSRQRPLNDELIRRAVERADAQQPAQELSPREDRIVRRRQQMPLMGCGHHGAPPPDRPDGHEREGDAAGQQHHQLEHLCPHHRPQTTRDRVHAGEERQKHDAKIRAKPEQRVERHRAEKQDGRDLHEHIGDEDEPRERRARGRPEPLLQELRHRVEAVAEIEWQEHPEQSIEADQNGAPFDGHGREPILVSRSDDSDEVVAGDIGRDDAPADHPPRELVARQEVVAFRRLGLERGDDADADHDEDVQREDGYVQSLYFQIHWLHGPS